MLLPEVQTTTDHVDEDIRDITYIIVEGQVIVATIQAHCYWEGLRIRDEQYPGCRIGILFAEQDERRWPCINDELADRDKRWKPCPQGCRFGLVPRS